VSVSVFVTVGDADEDCDAVATLDRLKERVSELESVALRPRGLMDALSLSVREFESEVSEDGVVVAETSHVKVCVGVRESEREIVSDLGVPVSSLLGEVVKLVSSEALKEVECD
jgi:hypothetical protein